MTERGAAPHLRDSAAPRPRGRVFTPPHIAQQLWDAVSTALAAGDPSHASGWTVAEPAAGQGALLRPILADNRVRRVHGIELCAADLAAWPRDARLCATHADALTLHGLDAPPSDVGNRFGATPPARLAGKQRQLLSVGWADAVVGNPPYLRETGNAELFRSLRSWNNSYWRPIYRKNANLHHFFWPLAVGWLKPGGVLAFLTPAYFLDSHSATPVRELLAREGTVLGVWRAGHETTFDVGVEAAITLWRKHDAAPPAPSVRRASRLRASLEPRGDSFAVPPDGGPWWWFDASSGEQQPLAEQPQSVRLGDLFAIVEGVSTGANRTRAADSETGAQPEGIFVLTREELARLALAPETRAKFVRQRWRSSPGSDEWVLVVPDGSLPGLERDPVSIDRVHAKLAEHLLQHQERLRGRAEMRRNPRRSWYATAWARGQRDATKAVATLCTAKWSTEAAFHLVPPTHVPMTDHRLLLPRVPMTEATLMRWARHLNAHGEHFARRLKRKARLLEFYGPSLADIDVPPLPPEPFAVTKTPT